MPSPIKAYCMKCRTSSNNPTARILKDYKMIDLVRNNRKYIFAVGKCPKCHGKIYRAYGTGDKTKRVAMKKSAGGKTVPKIKGVF